MKTYRVKLVIFEAMDKQYDCLVEVPDDFDPNDDDANVTDLVYFSADLDEDFEVCKGQTEILEAHAEEVLAPTEEDKKLQRWRLPPGFDKDDFDALVKVEENL